MILVICKLDLFLPTFDHTRHDNNSPRFLLDQDTALI